jgi:hypothetical protein
VTAIEAAGIFGVASAKAQPRDDQAGSIDQKCVYDPSEPDPQQVYVTSELKLPGSFPVDAQAEFDMHAAASGRTESDYGEPSGTDVPGLPGPAHCNHRRYGADEYDELYVLLSGGRLYLARINRKTPYTHSCADTDNSTIYTLKRFAETAIARIGA